MGSSTAASVELCTADGVRLSALTWETPGAPAAVVIAHGLSVVKEHPHVVAVAESLAAAGFAVVAYDGRGHGVSDGVCTLGADESNDVAAAVSLAGNLAPAVITVGTSMGGIAALRFAAGVGDALAGVVAVSTPATWRIHSARSLLAAAMTRTGPGRRLLQRRTGVRVSGVWGSPPAPIELAAAIRCPVALIHGANDRFIPSREATTLYQRLADPRHLQLVTGMGHGFEPLAIAPIVNAVTWSLAPTTTPARPPRDRCAPPSPD